MLKSLFFSLLIFSMGPGFVHAQSPSRSPGPLIPDFGAVWDVPKPDLKVNKKMEYKVMFDIYSSPDDPEALNRGLNTLARFMNMHAKAGVPARNIHVAAIVHNKASWDLLTDVAYMEKYGVKNPNRELIRQLTAAGADIYQCGQSLYSRAVPREALVPEVQVALSAMTAILQLKEEGYQLIKF